MTSGFTALITLLAIFGFLAVVTLLVTSVAFLYVLRELRIMLTGLRNFVQLLFPKEVIEAGEEPKTSKTGFAKWEKLWDEEREGRD